MQKKGQITIFIILGVLLLFAAGVYFFMYSNKASSAESAKIPVIKEVPYEFEPVNAHVQSCIAKIATDGLMKLGTQGGYIDVSQFSTNIATPTEASAVQFLPGSSVFVPYWFYLRSSNKCVGVCQFSYGRPNLYRLEGEPSIEGQLDNYLNSHLPDCIRDSSVLKDRGYTLESAGEIHTTTSVLDHDIGFLVDFPVKTTYGSNTYTINQFFLRVPLDMKSVYDQATVITNLQAHYKFLEKDLLNLIVGYSGVNTQKLPPMAATDFEFGGGKFWVKSQVKSEVQDILSRDIAGLQVYGSKNYHPVAITGNAFREQLYNDGMRVQSDQTFPNLNVEFDYLDAWPIYFDMNCNGETCKAESASSNLIGLIGIQRYNFLYDVSYPVLVEISDPTALNNQGYHFQFFLEANIRGNEPMNNTYLPLISAGTGDSSMLCDPDKRNSGNITVNVVDSIDKLPVSDVEVTYTCGDESCSVGRTTDGTLLTNFPVCLGGVVSFLKDGFVSNAQSLSTALGKSSVVNAQVIPLKKLQLNIQKFQFVKNTIWQLRDNPVELSGDEWGTLNLKRISGLGEEDYSTVLQINGTPSTISLAPGTYTVEATLFTNIAIAIPPQKRCENTLLSEKCYDVPPQEMKIDPPVPIGGLFANFTISSTDLSKRKMIVSVLAIDLADVPKEQLVIEDLNGLGKMKDYSNTYKTLLTPRFE